MSKFEAELRKELERVINERIEKNLIEEMEIHRVKKSLHKKSN